MGILGFLLKRVTNNGRAIYVAGAKGQYLREYNDTLTYPQIRALATDIRENSRVKSSRYETRIGDDPEWRLDHANRMIDLSASIDALLDEFLPALEVRPDNIALRGLAIDAIAHAHAEFEAMDHGLR